MKKRILSFITLLCMVTALLPANMITVSAYNGTKYGDYLYYTESNGEIKITDCDESATIIDIPETIYGKKVTSIGYGAFQYCTGLTSVTIPNSVTSIGLYAFSGCASLTEINIPNSVTNIVEHAFSGCANLTSIVIPESITKIGYFAFYGCTGLTEITLPNSVTSISSQAFSSSRKLKTVYYNGTEEEWNEISIGSVNSYLTDANRIYFAYLTFADKNGKELSKIKKPLNTCIDISDFEEKTEQVLHFYTDNECKNEFDLKTPITENTTLYLKYITNQYTYKFLDEDGKVLKEETVDYGTNIVPPENPSKQSTKQYTYTFDKWSGYTEGMTVTGNVTFTAQYTGTINKYTYKFLDNDNKVLKETIVDYGTVITPPETPADKEPYTFDYWDGYASGAELTDNVEFKAVYKYKTYTITAEGLDNSITATYNSNYIVTPQSKDGYNFIGYFTEVDGKGTQITNGKGESIKVYDIVGDLSVYPYFEATHFNKVELQGSTTAMPGDTIKQNAIFATDKDAMYVTATIQYPEYLNFKSISGGDFAEASKDKETVKDGYKYLDIICLYDFSSGNMPTNQNLVPFEITFDVATDAPIENTDISIKNVTLIGNGEYSITDITNQILEIKPKLAERVSITGNGSIDKITTYTATVSPDYTTNKDITWSVDDEEVATISQDGKLTPHKNGMVKVTATAQDGSGKYATKTVNVTAYATVTSLKYGDVDLNLIPDKYDYIVYVKDNTDAITLTPTYTGGTLKASGNDLIWLSGSFREFALTDTETVITLNRNNVAGLTDNAYTVAVVKVNELVKSTRTTVSNDGTVFDVMPLELKDGNVIILALYDDEVLTDMQYAVYCNHTAPIRFSTDKTYTNAKVMVFGTVFWI